MDQGRFSECSRKMKASFEMTRLGEIDDFGTFV